MSQSDWKFKLLEPTRTFIGGTSGSAVEHVSMSNPLTSSGDWCRGFYAYQFDTSVSMNIINNSDLSSSSGYEYGYGYSIRTWARTSQFGVVGLIFKSEDNSTGYIANAGEGKGYILRLRNEQLTLQCSTDTYNGNLSNTVDPSSPQYGSYAFSQTLSSLTLQHGLWHRLRMDVSPISGAYDKITIYTGSFGTWQQVYSVNLPRGRSKAYIPWANNPNGDGASATGYGCMGLKISANTVSNPTFIDGFEVYKERIIL